MDARPVRMEAMSCWRSATAFSSLASADACATANSDSDDSGVMLCTGPMGFVSRVIARLITLASARIIFGLMIRSAVARSNVGVGSFVNSESVVQAFGKSRACAAFASRGSLPICIKRCATDFVNGKSRSIILRN